MTRVLAPAAILAAMLTMSGCATTGSPCKPLRPYKIGGMTIYPTVCRRDHVDKACRHSDPHTWVKGCAYRRSSMPNKCWIIVGDDADGAKAAFHEHSHCGGAEENTARCDDWPGTDDAPAGQFCDKPWPIGLGREEVILR